jgi:hypothetical protein
MFTLFSRKASASAFAPSAPILLRRRFSMVSVYKKKVKMTTRNIREEDVHLIFSESISQYFSSFIADTIIFEIECGECLRKKCEDVNEKDHQKKIFTLFSRKASPSASAPSAPISLFARFSAVSIYDRN